MGNLIQTNYIYIDLDLIEGSILNGNKSSILYSFPNQCGFGELISIIPNNKEKKKLYIHSFNQFIIRFYSDQNKPINFQKTPVCMTLEIAQT